MSSNDWIPYKLGDICTDIAYGYTASADWEIEGPKFLRITDIQDYFINWKTVPQCPISYSDRKKYLLEIGDIVIARTGASTGSTFTLKDEVDAVFASYLIRYKINTNIANPFYIGYLLKSAKWKEYVSSIIGGSAQPGANAKQFADFDFILPDKSKQIKIVDLLTAIDEKIENNLKTNQTLEEIARTIFKEWFVREADESWGTKTFDDLVKPKRGKNITKAEAIEGEHPVVAGGLEPSCYHNKANTFAPVVTISSSGANAGFVRLYHNSVWAADCSYIDKTITPYVYFSYVFLKINQQILFDKQVGTAQPHIYPSHIMEMDILNYPKTLIEKFEKLVSPLFEKIKDNIAENETLKITRDSLLPKLMSGEIVV